MVIRAIAPDLTCLFCGGSGYRRYDVPVNHPLFGEPVPCTCIEPALAERRLEELRKRSLLPRRLRRETFASWSPSGKLNDRVMTAVQKFAREPGDQSLYLYGDRGSGKTKLAAAVVNDCLERRQEAAFFVVPDLLDHLRGTFHPNSETTYDELFEQVKTVGLLVLDELRTDNSSPWALEKLYQVLNHRYNAELPTVMTSNLAADEIHPIVRGRVATAAVTQLRMEKQK